MKKIVPIFFIMFVLSGKVFSSSLSFQIVQHNDSLTQVCQTSYIIEDELMNYFFDKGCIVSNEQPVISNSKKDDSILWQKGINLAFEGSCDNYIQIHLYFNDVDTNSSELVRLGYINKISWKISSIASGKVIDEYSSNISKPLGSDSEDNVRLFAKEIADKLYKVLKSRV